MPQVNEGALSAKRCRRKLGLGDSARFDAERLEFLVRRIVGACNTGPGMEMLTAAT